MDERKIPKNWSGLWINREDALIRLDDDMDEYRDYQNDYERGLFDAYYNCSDFISGMEGHDEIESEKKYLWIVSIMNCNNIEIKMLFFDNEKAANDCCNFYNEDSHFAKVDKYEMEHEFTAP